MERHDSGVADNRHKVNLKNLDRIDPKVAYALRLAK